MNYFRCVILLTLGALLLAVSAAGGIKRFETVVLDPGHGGKDRGAIWGGVEEAKLNLAVALRVEEMLKARGVNVVMTRRTDKTVSLRSRAAIANRHKDAIFVSVHFNACLQRSVRGAETFFYGLQGKVLAYEIQRQLIGHAKMRDRKIRKRSFSVLVNTRCPAVLVECGYISHTAERKRCNTKAFQKLAAEAIVNGLMEYRD